MAIFLLNIRETIAMKKIVLLLILLGIGHWADAQRFGFFKTRKAIKSLKVAQQFINEGNYDKAKEQLYKTLEIKEDFAVAYRELGKVNLLMEMFEPAVMAYQKSFQLNPKLSRAAYFECGEAYFRLSKFDTAQVYFNRFEYLKNERFTNAKKEVKLEKEYDTGLENRKSNLEFALEAIKNPSTDAKVANLGPLINSDEDEYMPTITGDGLVLIYTTKQTYSSTVKETGENIFISKRIDGSWSQGLSFDASINSDVNEGMAKFAADERYMYYAGCEREDAKGGCDIYQAKMKGNALIEVNTIPGNINTKYWESQPSISCDGSMMFFSSSREDGEGGSDIYVSYKMNDGRWSHGENLGDVVNTTGDEEAPFISPDGLTLYFTSTGHTGMGDGDLFMSRLDQVNDSTWGWREPVNLGYPFNTPYQEIGLFVQPDGKTVYFASARQDGYGGLDIYKSELPEEFRPYDRVLVEGQIKDEFTEEPLPLKLDILRNGIKWEIETDKDGWYFICLPSDKAYAFQVVHNNYEYYMEAAYLPTQNNAIPFRFDIDLIPKRRLSMRMEKEEPKEIIYTFLFDFDSFALNEKTRGQLKELVQKLETESGWEVNVIGYTDNIGNMAHNQLLSEQRARAIVQYLDNMGIKVKSISQEGRGALVSKDKIMTEEERAKNRKVEVVIKRD